MVKYINLFPETIGQKNIVKSKINAMSRLLQEKSHFDYGAIPSKSKSKSTSRTIDIQRIEIWIQQLIEEKNSKTPLSQEKRKKLQFLLSQLKKTYFRPQEKTVDSKSSPKHETSHTQNKDSDTIEEKTDVLSKKFKIKTSNERTPNQEESSNLNREILNAQKTSESKSYQDIADQNGSLDTFHHDMARMAKSVSELCRITSLSGTKNLRAEFEKILLKMDALAKERSLFKIENNWQVSMQHLKKLDFKSLHKEIGSLAHKIDSVKHNFDKEKNADLAHNLNEKILSILVDTQNILSLLQPLNEKILTEKFSTIDVKLSEIKKAVEANERAIEDGNNTFIKKLEGRLTTIDQQIQNIQDEILLQNQPNEKNSKSLETLSKHLNKLDNSYNHILKLSENINQIPELVEKLGKNSSFENIPEYLVELSNKVDSISQSMDDKMLSRKLDTVLQNLEDIARPHPFSIEASFKKLECYLKDITSRLEKKHNIPEGDSLLRNLDIQISCIKDLITSNSQSETSSNQADQRISRLEDYVSTTDEYIIETSQKTAQLMLKSLDERLDKGRLFKSDTKTLENQGKNHVEQMVKNFEKLHEMLVNISKELEISRVSHDNPSPDQIKIPNSSRIEKSPISFENTSSVEDKKLVDHSKTIGFHETNEKQRKSTEASYLSSKNNEKEGFPLSFKFKKDTDSSNVYESHQEKNPLAIDEDAPNNIQKILERVSSIQDSIWNDNNTVTDYISAARRAASESAREEQLLSRNNNSQNMRINHRNFLKIFMSKYWFAPVILIAILVSSALL
ncbi:hypothetical protein [Candidatus Liberibacter sp.]|uniref:hypothetical protein n=1 Tax=Candidatus Liberibacter sp. TaxID=34022 RepID=UPI0015F39482|nr:hypothetical protein [Candidatus Liberibacter sp.]MBA5723763.1 hypothetical protein [Candidatus Liberibacter sp.]